MLFLDATRQTRHSPKAYLAFYECRRCLRMVPRGFWHVVPYAFRQVVRQRQWWLLTVMGAFAEDVTAGVRVQIKTAVGLEPSSLFFSTDVGASFMQSLRARSG